MKKQMLVIWTAIIVVLLSVGSIAAQDGKKMNGDGGNNEKSASHGNDGVSAKCFDVCQKPS